jgi:hypothetical protein
MGGRRGEEQGISFETRDDPVLIFATREYLFFGIHGATDPTYRGTGWTRRYSSETTGYPAWPGDVLRCAYSANGWGLPDLWTRPPTPLTINREGLPWLRATFSKGLTINGGDPFSKVAETFARCGGDFYVPLTRVGSDLWARFNVVRLACLKAGHVVDDSTVREALERRKQA